jgi:pimeloyl-ACP methyl ester carboxylesterase
MTESVFGHRFLRLFSAFLSVFGVAGLCAQAHAQSRDELRERFREECRSRYFDLRGEEKRAKVHACVQAKFGSHNRARAAQAVTAPVNPQNELKLVEGKPWLSSETRGPEGARGVIFFVRGYAWTATTTDNYLAVPYFLRTLSSNGWDVIVGKVPQGMKLQGTEIVTRGAAFMRRRVRELKEQGYKRVVLAGHSWGGWGAMLAAGDPSFAANAIILSAPNTFGRQISIRTGRANAASGLSAALFGKTIGKIKVPTVLILPNDPEWDPDPAARGAIAEKHFRQSNIPHIVLAKPQGFTGHFAGWLPIFDYVYGRCIEAFLEDPASAECSALPPSNSDFRSIQSLDQIPNAAERAVQSAEDLKGKTFSAFTLLALVTARYDYLSAAQRKTVHTDSSRIEPIAFRNGMHCVSGSCTKLIKWGDEQLLEFDPRTGKLVAWWIEH